VREGRVEGKEKTERESIFALIIVFVFVEGKQEMWYT